MNKANLIIIVFAIACLLVAGNAQTRAQQQGQVGRYQLVGAPYKWLATVDHKLVVDEQNQLFRIDTATGETAILGFQADQNGDLHSFWNSVAK